MKSKSFRPISTLVLGAGALLGSLCVASPTYAYDIEASAVDPSLLPVGTEINGKRYWSVTEMTEASALINAKRKELCAGDSMCEEELSWQQMDELGGIYRALDPFENIHFMLTYVNPSANTVKFLYHDEGRMLSRMLGKTIRHDIASVYAVWVEESLGSITTTSSNWLAYGQRAPYHLGSAEEVEAATHLVFDESEKELGSGWFTPNVEREYQVTGSDLTANTTAQIHFSLNATGDGGHSHGTLDYSSCINSPNYVEGMECRMMYSEDGAYTNIPFDPALTLTIAEAPTTEQSTVASTDTADSDFSTDSETTTGYGSTTISSAATETVESTDTTTASVAAGTPNTGVATREDCNEDGSSEFPWWTIALPFAAAFFIFSWWFLLPLFKHSNEKNA